MMIDPAVDFPASLSIERRCLEIPLWKEAYFRRRREMEALLRGVDWRSFEYDLLGEAEWGVGNAFSCNMVGSDPSSL
jgi:hypothetical protein